MVAAPARIRLPTLLTLVFGRGAFRLSQLASTVALLPLWGAARYGTYAGAVAVFSWIIALLVAGPEKTVLKLLPRAPRTGPLIIDAAGALLWVLPVPVLLAFAVAAAVAPHGPVAVYLGVAAMATTMGALLLLVGLHRAGGRPRYDSRAFLALTVAQVGLLGLAALGLAPLGYVAGMVLAQTVLCVVLLVRLGRPSLAIRSRPAFVRRIWWTVVLMGSPDVCLYLCTSVLVALLAASSFHEQVGPFVAVDIVWSAGVNFLIYGLRVYAPWVSVRLVGARGGGARRAARRIAAWVVAGELSFISSVVTVWAATDVLEGGAIAVWAVLFAALTPMLVALILAGYVVENSDAPSTRITGLATAAGLVAATLVGIVAVPLAGGVGALVAFASAGAVQALTLRIRLAHRAGPHKEKRHVAA